MTIIVDSKLLAYNELHAHKPVVNLFSSIIPMINKIERETLTDVTDVIFVYDIGKSDYRLSFWSQYKGTRNYSTVPDDFKSIYEDTVLHIARELGIKSFPIRGVEADDLAGILSNKITDEVILVSSDLDWLGLIFRHEHVRYFNIKQWQLMGKQEVIVSTSCNSEEQFLIKKCITGDSGDRILGLPTIGPVKFSKWAEEAFKLPDENLKEEFLKLCSSIKKDLKVHQDYLDHAGISTCEELYDFNMKLGRVMSGIKHLSKEQVIDLSSWWKTSCIPREPNLQKASELTAQYSQGHTTAFGDPWELSEGELQKYKEIYEAKTARRTS